MRKTALLVSTAGAIGICAVFAAAGCRAVPPASKSADADCPSHLAEFDLRPKVCAQIRERYPQDIEKQAALGLLARSINGAIEAGDSGESKLAREAAAAISLAIDNLACCFEQPTSEPLIVEAFVADTAERRKSYDRFNQLMDGAFFGDADQ